MAQPKRAQEKEETKGQWKTLDISQKMRGANYSFKSFP